MSQNTTVGIIVFDGVLTCEVTGPVEVFAIASEQAEFRGTKVMLIGVEQKPTIRTGEGLELMVNATIADNILLDILLVPGGNDVDHLLAHEELNAFIQHHEKTAQWLGSVCAGAFILGGAGVLDGKQATTWFGGESSLQAHFPAIQVVQDKPVVVDKRRITANGGLVSYRAALVLLGQLSSAELAATVYKRLNMNRLGDWAQIESDIRAVQRVVG